MIYNINEIWQRISQRDEYRGKVKLSDLTYQGIPLKVSLTSGQAIVGTPINFSAGACIFGITAGAQMNGQAATVATRPGLDMFECQIQYQQQRYIVGNGNIFAIGSSVFGTGMFNSFPGEELIVPTNGQLLYSVTNLTTSTIDVYFVHHVLIPRAVG